MYLVKVLIRNSTIEGKGVFSVDNIPKGTVVWKFNSTHDQSLSSEEFDALNDAERARLYRVAYLSPSSNRWVFPPDDDPARYTNHSTANNLSVVFDSSSSDEPIFIANRDIPGGEELTVDYTEFDGRPNKTHVWD